MNVTRVLLACLAAFLFLVVLVSVTRRESGPARTGRPTSAVQEPDRLPVEDGEDHLAPLGVVSIDEVATGTPTVVEGLIRADDDRPLPGARVVLFSVRSSAECVADGAGRFCCVMPRRSLVLTLRATLEGYSPSQLRVTVPAVGDPLPVTVTMRAGHVVRGRILWLERPRSDIVVTLYCTGTCASPTRHTDAPIPDDPAAWLREDTLHLSSESFAFHNAPAGDAWLVVEGMWTHVLIPAAYEIVVPLRQPARLVGTLTTREGGTPLAAAVLRLHMRTTDGRTTIATSTTTADGGFQFPMLQAGRVVKMVANAHLDATVPRSPLRPGDTVAFDSTVADPVAIEGRVTTDGRGAPGAVVTARGSVDVTVSSDDNGHFRMGDLGPGEYLVSATTPGWRCAPMRVRVDAQTPSRPVLLALEPVSAVEVRGLTDARARLVGDGLERTALVDDDGRAVFGNLPPMTRAQIVTRAGTTPTFAVPRSTTVVVQLTGSPPRVIRGTVRTTAGVGVGGAVVTAVSGKHLRLVSEVALSQPHWPGSCQTDSSGRFDLPVARVLDDLYVIVRHPSYAPATCGPVMDAASPIDVLLQSGSTVYGVLNDGEGRGVVGAKVMLRGVESMMPEGEAQTSQTVETGVNGRFAFHGLGRGRYSIWAASYIGTLRPIEVRDGDGPVILSYDYAGWISGIVVDRDGQGVPYAGIGAGDASVVADMYGVFFVGNLPRGTYTVRAESFGDPAVASIAGVATGTDVVIELGGG